MSSFSLGLICGCGRKMCDTSAQCDCCRRANTRTALAASKMKTSDWEIDPWTGAKFRYRGDAEVVDQLVSKYNATVAELVDAQVSKTCSERSVGSSPTSGTKQQLEEVA